MSETPRNREPGILLAHHLEKLKLPTFLRECDKIARLCASEGADHVRYLLRLAELELIEARGDKQLLRLQKRLAGLKLVIIDELGFVPLSKTGAESAARAATQSSRSSPSATNAAPSWSPRTCRSTSGPRSSARSA